MKKFLSIMLVLTSLTMAANAQTGTDSSRKSNYYYYPESNVYYNQSMKTYSYFDNTSAKWNTVTKLPSTYTITPETAKTPIDYSGTQIWDLNKQHQQQYGQPATPATLTPATTTPAISPAGTTPPKP